MAVDFRPDLITKSIVYCMRSECNQSSSCLRYLAYKNSVPFFHHSFIDPRITLIERECEAYLSNEVQIMGRGFRRAMGLVQYGRVRDFQVRICYESGCGRSQFYRYSSGTLLLTKEQQAVVSNVSEEFNVTQERLFDTYEEAYDLPY